MLSRMIDFILTAIVVVGDALGTQPRRPAAPKTGS